MPDRYIGMGYWEIISRQMSIVTKSQQTRFKEAKIAVIGCGGIGGAVIEMLARMGIGELNIIDKDSFDMSNLNRQAMSSLDVIGQSKSIVTKEKIGKINPYTKINAFDDELNEKNMNKVLKNCDIAIDALDNLITRILLSRYTRDVEIPFVHGAIHGTKGQLSIFTHETKSYEELFSLPSYGKELNDEVRDEIKKISAETPPAIGPIPNIIGALEAFEAYKYITNIGNLTLSPKVLNIDLLDLESFQIIEL